MPRLLLFFLCLTACLVASDNSLLLHLKLDEGAGTVAKDYSGRGHDATLVNPQWTPNGVQGNALRLNGKDAWLKIPAHKDFQLTDQFTYSIWFKKDVANQGMNLLCCAGYSKGFLMFSNGNFVAFARPIPKGGKLPLSYFKFSSGTAPINPFHNLVVTSSREDGGKVGYRFYLDGKLMRNSPNHGGETVFFVDTPLNLPPGADFSIGRFASNEGQWFAGIIDEVKLYNRPLGDDEIKAAFDDLSKPQAVKAEAVQLKHLALPPLSQKKAAVYQRAKAITAPQCRPTQWFVEQLSDMGMQCRIIDDSQVASLPSSDIQLLVIPSDVFCMECEDAVFKFLARGGNVLAASCVPTVYNYDETGNVIAHNLNDNVALVNGVACKRHSRGWFAPFFIRNLDIAWRWAIRSAEGGIPISAEAAELLGDALPPVAGPYPKLFYTPTDKWNVILNYDGGYGNGANTALAHDVQFDIYRENNGIGGDFTAYRYYNAKLFGVTFVVFGKLGTRLLADNRGADVLKAAVHLTEMKLPSEQPRQYYETMRKLDNLWTEFSCAQVATIAALRDAALLAHTLHDTDAPFARLLDDAQASYEKLLADHKRYLQLITTAGKHKEIAALAETRLADIQQAQKAFAKWNEQASKYLEKAKPQSAPAVKNPVGQLQLVATMTYPTSLPRFRGDFFPTLKSFGVTRFAGRLHDWYAADPAVQKQFRGLDFDHKFAYGLIAKNAIHNGVYDAVNATVKETPPRPFPEEQFDAIKRRFDLFAKAGIPQVAIGTCDETCLGFNYWDKQAEKDFQNFLRKTYHDDVNAMNAQCNTAFKTFGDVHLPMKQPATQPEHAVWEHWRRCREQRLESHYAYFYKRIKDMMPDISVFHLPSTGSFGSPLYGSNLYNISRHEDYNGLDGTAIAPEKEWMVYDLTRKPLLTEEWGGCYHDSSLYYLYGRLWQEVAPGTLGVELHSLNFGSDSTSFIDQTDQPRDRLAIIRQFMLDARKVQHVLLDGHRPVPEIGLLYSQTTRCHDQGWGYHGAKTASKHVQTLTNAYGIFLAFNRSARVFTEEYILENGMPPVKAFILPQTTFLSEQIQNVLMDYAKNGGTLLLEGRVGQFDPFGKTSNLILREADIIPAFADAKSLTCNGAQLPLDSADAIFSPIAKGDVIASFDGKDKNCSPAIVSVPYGKGRIIVSGSELCAVKYAYAPALMETILGTVGITQRIIVSDDDVLSREWRLGDDTYILLTSARETWKLKEVSVALRGKCSVEDALFGMPVSTDFRDGYTHFKTLVPTGCRVFRLPKASIAERTEKAPQKYTLAGQAKNTAAESISLPFEGWFYDDKPLVFDGYTFELTTVSAGYDDAAGETYMTVRKGHEVNKQRILVNTPHYFRMKDRIFKVFSSKNFCKFPFHAEVVLEQVGAVPPNSRAALALNGKTFTLSNDRLELKVDPSQGARVTSMLLRDRYSQQLSPAAAQAAFSVIGWMPGIFAEVPFKPAEQKMQGGVGVKLTSATQVQDLEMTQTLSVPDNTVGFALTLDCKNMGSQPQDFALRWHPELAIGGSADTTNDLFFASKADGSVEKIRYEALNASKFVDNFGCWVAVVDSAEKLAYVNQFAPEQSDRPYIWDDAGFYTLEIGSPKASLTPGNMRTVAQTFDFVRGVTGVDAWRYRIAVHVPLPEFIDQTHPLETCAEIGTSSISPLAVSADLAISQNGKTIRKLPQISGSVCYGTPLVTPIAADMAECDDGDYELVAAISTEQGAFTMTKPLRCSGKILAELMAQYNALRKKTSESKSSNAFAIRIELEELRRTIAECDVPLIRQKIQTLTRKLQQ